MYVDALMILSGSTANGVLTGQNLTGATSPTYSTNVIDLSQHRDMGQGQNLYARFQVVTAISGPTALAMKVMATDDPTGFTSALTVGFVNATADQMIAGARFATKIDPIIANIGKRYLVFRYEPTGTSPTAGSIYADVGIEIQDGQKFYPAVTG
jgi:hypothetical protein